MRYANYKFNARGVNNLGDNMQIIAIDNIYESMGIDLKDIEYIDVHNLSTYDGDYVILPVTMPLVDYQEGGISGRFSNRIIPVFIGLTMVKESLDECEVNYYKKYEPIGCRDERTLNTLRKYGIISYLHGCITATLPYRKSGGDDVFIVDVDEKFEKYIPQNLKEKAIYRNQLISEKLEDPKSITLKQYNEYKQRAKLVITSRLHCALPCLAAGIPVVLLKELVSYRFSWIEKILPIYTLNNVDSIDWSPKSMLTEEHKQRVLNLTISRLRNAFESYQAIYDLSYYYENRIKNDYVNDACYSIINYIDGNWLDKEKRGAFSFWGLTQMSEFVYDYVVERYPNMKLAHVYDSFRKIKFKNIESALPETIAENIDEFVFVTTNGAEEAAKSLFKRIGKPDGTYCFLKLVNKMNTPDPK